MQRSQSLGLISGVSGRATDLAAGTLLDDLVAMGLDHLTLYYASAEAALHDSFFGAGDHAAAEALFARTQALALAEVGHVPLVQATLEGIEATLERLQALNVQDDPTVEHFVRQTGGQWLLTATKGLDAVVTIDSIGCVLPLSEIYDKIEFSPEDRQSYLRRIKEPDVEYGGGPNLRRPVSSRNESIN